MAIRGFTTDKQEYLTRLRKIEGQMRGLQRMIDDDTYCIDVITQIGSACGALQSVAVGLLDQHIRHCVTQAAASPQGDGDLKLAEATPSHPTTPQAMTSSQSQTVRPLHPPPTPARGSTAHHCILLAR